MPLYIAIGSPGRSANRIAQPPESPRIAEEGDQINVALHFGHRFWCVLAPPLHPQAWQSFIAR